MGKFIKYPQLVGYINSGNVVWLEKSVRFIVDGPVATMEFTGTARLHVVEC